MPRLLCLTRSIFSWPRLCVWTCLLIEGATLHAYNILFTASAPAMEGPYGQAPINLMHNDKAWGRSFYFQGTVGARHAPRPDQCLTGRFCVFACLDAACRLHVPGLGDRLLVYVLGSGLGGGDGSTLSCMSMATHLPSTVHAMQSAARSASRAWTPWASTTSTTNPTSTPSTTSTGSR